MSSSSTGRVILVRHGESEGNATRTFTPNTEVPLTERGRRQALRAAEIVGRSFRPVCIVASPYTRARQTGEIIASALELELRIQEPFREQWIGDLRGQPYDSVLEDPSFDPKRRWEWRPSGGESLADVRGRVGPAFDSLAQANVGRDIVVVSHGGVMLALWAHCVGSWEQARSSGNAAILCVEHDGRVFGAPRVVDAGDAGFDETTGETGG